MAISDETPGLFGWVPAPPRGQGRPGFAWTKEKSNRIMVLFAAGYAVKAVAQIIGCDAKTLRKVFPLEVRERERAELVIRSGIMATLVAEAEAGNVAASKELTRLIEAEQAKVINGAIGRRPPSQAKKAEPKKGKKQLQAEEAESVGGLYTPRQAPSGLTN